MDGGRACRGAVDGGGGGTTTLAAAAASRLRRHRALRVLLCVALLLAIWFPLNEWFGIKLIYEQEISRWRLPHRAAKGTRFWSRVWSRLRHRLSDADAEALHLNANRAACRRVVRLGHRGDGGWDVCADWLPPQASALRGLGWYGSHRPPASASDPPCVVFSVGIGDDVSFDQDFVTHFPACTVYAFDPSIARNTGDDFGPRIKFFRVGLDAKDVEPAARWQWTTMRLKTMMQMVGVDHIDVLKMDIEGMEWNVWSNDPAPWFRLGAPPLFTQLLVELHFERLGERHPGVRRRRDAERVRVLGEIQDAGMVPFRRRENWRYTRPANIYPSAEKGTPPVVACTAQEVSYVFLPEMRRKA